MLTARRFRPGRSELVDLDDGDGDGLRWVDLVDATPDELARVQRAFDLHPLAMEDVSKHGQRPKLEAYPTHAFLVAHAPDRSELDVFIGPGWLVTVRERNERGHTWEPSLPRIERVVTTTPEVGHLLHVLLDELVDGYFDALDRTEDVLEAVEERVFDGDQPPDEAGIQHDMFVVRRELLRLRRSVVPLREVLAGLLRHEVPWVDTSALVLLQDVYDHTIRAADQIDAQRELIGNAVDAHLALISNRLNQVMKRLTAWGSILFGASLVAGIYGMNFQHMPETEWWLGYPLALGIMAALSVWLYVMFKRRDWL